MDLYITLSIGVWLAGGVFSSAWLFWLDRERREMAFPLKFAALVGWPVFLPVLLHERGDLTGWEAGRNAIVWLALLSPGVSVQFLDAFRPPSPGSGPPRVAMRPIGDIHPRPCQAPFAPAAQPTFTATFPNENDKREAVRYWNSGIIFYQRGDYEKARDEWNRCRALDSSNSDCATGLGRIAQSYGLASAVR